MGNAWSPPPNCLQIELRGGGKQCDCGPLRVEEWTVANDQRVLARVSGEEAREYIRGVNAHVAKHTGKYRWPICGCVASFVLGAVLFGVMMGVFFEENRLRCNSRLCERGEDPLVDGCCVFWCCGEGIDGGKHPHELPARPYNTSWDVWSSETYFGIDERCSLYHDGDEHRPDDHTPRDANYGCGSCPARLTDEKGACKTMFEGKAKDYEVTWPLLFLIPYLLPIPFIIAFICASACAVPRLYDEAFADWKARGIVTHVTYQRGGKHSPNYLRLWFPPGQAMQMQPVATGPVVQPGTGTFLVQVPPGAQAGQMMQVTSPAGVAMQVQIPAGMYPGATFAVASPAAPAVGVVEGVSYAAEEAGEPVLQAKVVPEREW